MRHVRVVPIGIHALLIVLLLACDLNVSLAPMPNRHKTQSCLAREGARFGE